MRRLLYDKLITWKERENRKPLVLKGVRQCGKTFLLREFGEKNYADVAYFKGALTENYVLCELMALRDEIPYYWKSENIAEVDFIAQFGMDIVPIEVKSERNMKSKSLAAYRKKYQPRISIRTSMEKFSGTDVKNVPLYMFWRIEDYVRG